MVLNLNVIKFGDAAGVLEVINYDNRSGDFMSVVDGRNYSTNKGNWLGKNSAPLQVRFTGRLTADGELHNHIVLVTAWDSGNYQLRLQVGRSGDFMDISVGGSRDVHLLFHSDGKLTISSPGGFTEEGDDVVVRNASRLI